MDVTKELIIRSESIENMYDFYKREILLVNRRYQRKLVWTVEEKENFIDSICHKYPVPLFLVAEVQYKSKTVFEIIDGMQRLNAIMSFIEGEFSLHGKYFDLESTARTKLLKDNGDLVQNEPRLEREKCAIIASYSIPLSVSSFDDKEIIDDIFKRINSNGKHLSRQELRQAGSISEFDAIVRSLSAEIRGDVAHSDQLTLNSMKNISINNRHLNYGIDINEIFWKKHNIITSDNIRESRDEELIAHLLSSLLLYDQKEKEYPESTAKNLDKYYDNDQNINEQILKFGRDYIENVFRNVFGEIKKVFEISNNTFYKTLFKKETKYVNRTYQIVFLAFYELLVHENKHIVNYQKLYKNLCGLGDNIFKNTEVLNDKKERNLAINSLKGVIAPLFEDRKETDPVYNNGAVKLESLLSRSRTESTNYDFKIGFHRLDATGGFDEDCLNKVLKSLTAMVNISKESVGYIVIGIADKKAAADTHERIYKVKPRIYQGFYITGVQEEVKKYQSDDKYREFIENKIRRSPITPTKYVDEILRNVDYFEYYNKTIYVFKISSLGEPSKFDNKLWERRGTSTEKVESDKEFEVYKRFFP